MGRDRPRKQTDQRPSRFYTTVAQERPIAASLIHSAKHCSPIRRAGVCVRGRQPFVWRGPVIHVQARRSAKEGAVEAGALADLECVKSSNGCSGMLQVGAGGSPPGNNGIERACLQQYPTPWRTVKIRRTSLAWELAEGPPQMAFRKSRVLHSRCRCERYLCQAGFRSRLRPQRRLVARINLIRLP